MDSSGNKRIENEGLNLLEVFNEGNELDIFECLSVKNLLTFKWNSHAFKSHLVGCIAHFFYVTFQMIYINAIYINNNMEDKRIYSILMIVAIIYPTMYEFV